MSKRQLVLSAVVFAAFACHGVLSAQKKQSDWNDYLGGTDSSHYSALKQINAGNVNQLDVAWSYANGDEVTYTFSPLVIDNIAYFAAKQGSLVAVDATTGKRVKVPVDYTDDNNHVELWTVSAQVQHRFTRALYGFATILWHDEQNDLNGDTKGLEEQIELQWRHRQTYIYGILRNSDLTSTFQDNHFQFFEVGVKREF